MAKQELDHKGLQAISTVKAAYDTLDKDRITVIDKAVDCAKVTIPSVLVASSHTEQTALVDTFNSIGARAVNNLSSKLLLSLLPPSTPFFRLNPSDDVLAEGGTTTEIEKQLAALELRIVSEVERKAYRSTVFEAFKSLIVTGNSLLLLEEGTMSMFKLDRYVINRDFSGNVLEIILKETISGRELPEDQQEGLEADELKKPVDVYTRYYSTGNGNWLSYQEIKDEVIEGSETTFKDDTLPVIPLRWSKISGENYGRGMVEAFLGDLRSLEGLTQLLLEHTSIAATTIFGVKPGSVLSVSDLEGAENGGVIIGDLERDVSVLRVDKGSDMQLPMQMSQEITQRISIAFMLQSGAVRNSERTTAVEVQYLAKELEDTLGGIYSVISQEFQLPLVKLILNDLKYDLEGSVEISVVTGLESLGRNSDLQKLRELNAMIAEVNPQYLTQYLKVDEYLKRIATAVGVQNTEGLFRSDEEVQQQQAAQAQAQAAPDQQQQG